MNSRRGRLTWDVEIMCVQIEFKWNGLDLVARREWVAARCSTRRYLCGAYFSRDWKSLWKHSQMWRAPFGIGVEWFNKCIPIIPLQKNRKCTHFWRWYLYWVRPGIRRLVGWLVDSVNESKMKSPNIRTYVTVPKSIRIRRRHFEFVATFIEK